MKFWKSALAAIGLFLASLSQTQSAPIDLKVVAACGAHAANAGETVPWEAATDGYPCLSISTSGLATDAKLDDIITSLSQIQGFVDGLEALQTSTNTKLDTLHTDLDTTIAGFVDGLEGLITSSNTKLDTLHTDIATTVFGAVDGIEALIGTTNTDLGAPGATVCATDTGSCSLNALLQRIAQRLTTIIAGIPVTNAGTFAVQAAQSGTWTVTGAGGTFPITAASGAIASGAISSGAVASGAFSSGSIASGAVASGAFASGAVSSGAYASGSIASGAVVDLTNQQTPVTAAAATATKGTLLGCRYQSTPDTATNTQQMAVGCDTRTNQKVSIFGADSATGAVVATGADGATLGASLNVNANGKVYNGSTEDLARSVGNGTNSTGTGITAAGILAQCDDTSPTSITENSFGNAAMDCTNHSLITSQAGTGATSVTRPADTTAYAANDAMSNSTSSPTAGGFTLTGACRKSGGIGMIQSAVILMSTAAGTSLQGEIWLFNQSVTNINDNAAFSVSDGDMANFVGKIAFTTTDGASNNASATVAGVNLSYTCTGSANLRYLVKVLNAYTPASAEVLTVTPTYIYLN